MEQQSWASRCLAQLHPSGILSTLFWSPLVGTELVSAIYGSLTTPHPPSWGSLHEPHSPPIESKAASKHLRQLLTMTEEPHRLLALAAGTVSSMPC